MIEEQLAALDSASRPELVSEWVKHFGKPPPPSLSVQLLRSGLVYECQARKVGGLSRRLNNELVRLKNSQTPHPMRIPRAGAQLMREWNGVAHIVDIADDVFRYRGKPYKSLTAIAFEITGARWSGPRFFGLKTRAPHE